MAEAGEGDGGTAEQEVAGENGHFVAEFDVGGGRAAAGGGVVDYVVVEERSCVDQFCDFGEAALGGEDVRG